MLVPKPGKVVTPNDYRYGFQGQEKDDELKGEGNSLNYTFRMHDPRVGRFFTVDPLTKEYPHYTPYSFSGNVVIHAIELEGLEPHVLFDNLQQAAINFGEQYGGYSINNKKEVGANFYKVETAKGIFKYAYTTPVIGLDNKRGVKISRSDDIPANAVKGYVGNVHTHGEAYQDIFMYDRETNRRIFDYKNIKTVDFEFDKKYEILDGDNNPSGDDGVATESYSKDYNDVFEQSYTFTPSGLVWKQKIKEGKLTEEVNVKMSRISPSDKNSPLRINTNTPDPMFVPKDLPLTDAKHVTEQLKNQKK